MDYNKKTLPVINSLFIEEGYMCFGVYNKEGENKNKLCLYDVTNDDVRFFPLVLDDENIFYPKSDKGAYFISHVIYNEYEELQDEKLKVYDKNTLKLISDIYISKLVKKWEDHSNIVECAKLNEDKVLIIFEMSPLNFSLRDLFSNDDLDTFLCISIYDINENKFNIIKEIKGDFYDIDFDMTDKVIKCISDNDEEDNTAFYYKMAQDCKSLILEKKEIIKDNVIIREDGKDSCFEDRDFGLEIIEKNYNKKKKSSIIYKALKTGKEIYTQQLKMFDDTDYEIVENMNLLMISESRGNAGYLHIYEKINDDFCFVETIGFEGEPNMCAYNEYEMVTAEDENGLIILSKK